MKLPIFLRNACTWLTRPLQARIAHLVYAPGNRPEDFLQPCGEPAWMDADSVTWRIFHNPVAMLVGGVTAVLLELAEPRVRTGVWEHTTFRQQPMLRLQRTGYAAMMTAFGARSRTAAMIAQVNTRHARIAGATPEGIAYRADDPDLLTWVHATATYGFLEAYTRCVHPLHAPERNRFYGENQVVARLYGVASPPCDEAALQSLFDAMAPHLERSDIVIEFLDIMARLRLMPAPLGVLQRLLLRAAVQCLPAEIRERLGLDHRRWALAGWQWAVVRAAGRMADGLNHPQLPAMLARRRLGGPRQGTDAMACSR